MADPQSNTPTQQQFFQLLPVTLEIAGLTHAEPSKYYNDDQMELRAQAIRKAFRHARNLLRDVAAEQTPVS